MINNLCFTVHVYCETANAAELSTLPQLEITVGLCTVDTYYYLLCIS